MAESISPTKTQAVESPSPVAQSEPSVFTVDIKDIATNVKYKMIGLFMEKEGPVKEIFNWKETPDLGDAWFDHNKELRKYAYYGEKVRNVKRPVRDFMKHVFHIQGIRGSEELEAAEADIQRTIERQGDRRIEIYNMSAVIAYLCAAKGVSVDPDTLTYYLNYKKIRSARKSFKSARKNYMERIDAKIKILRDAEAAYENLIQRTLAFFDRNPNIGDEPVVKDRRSMRVVNVERKLYLNAYVDRIRTLRKKYDALGVSFWDLKLAGTDANEYLFDFLLSYIPNLCKLNPPPTGDKPTL